MAFWDEITLDKVEEENKYIDNLDMGMELLTRLLSTNTEITEIEKKMQHLDKLIENDYMELVKKDDLANEAEVYVQVIKARNLIEEMIKFPFLTNKKIVAIGGGFSAGKSQFINSILGDDILPTDTRPTTSIPSYIAKGNCSNIYAFNIFGNKNKIDNEAVKAISHVFSSRYNLSFTQILKNIIMQSDKMTFSNIAFLDTPGYTKSDFYSKEDNTDENIARVHLKKADYLIWIIDIEKGTIPSQDLEFIKSLEFKKPIFFIFNKADKKEPSEIEDIIKIAQENIEKSGIKIAGITAYSSHKKREYVKDSLVPFLEVLNQSEKKADVYKEFSEVFDTYFTHFINSIEEEKEKLMLLNKIALFSNLDKERDMIRKLLIKSQKKIKTQKKLLEEFTKLAGEFNLAIKDIIDEIENNRLFEDEKDILDNNKEKLVTETIRKIEEIKDDFKKKCNSRKHLNIEEIKVKDIREKIVIKKVEEKVDISKWYNPFTWNKTKTVIKEIPEINKIPYMYISKSSLEERMDEFIKDISKELIKRSDDISNIDIKLDSIINDTDKEVENKTYIKKQLSELFEEMKQNMAYHMNTIYYDGEIEKNEIINMIDNEIIEFNSFNLLDKLLTEKTENIANNVMKILEDKINEMNKDIYGLTRR